MSNKTKYNIIGISELKEDFNKDKYLRSHEKTYPLESKNYVKRSASGKSEFEETDLILIERELTENNSNENNKKYFHNKENDFESNIENNDYSIYFRDLLDNLETDKDFYKCFRLTEEQSVSLINIKFILIIFLY